MFDVKKLPIGYENFGEIVQSDMHYVDKSLFIKDLLDRRDKVTLITRPRRFGKTLNLSMLEHFLAANVARRNTQGLFDTLNIAKVPGDYIATHQGQYVVIALSFKDVRYQHYTLAYTKIQSIMANLFIRYRYLLDSPRLTHEEKQSFLQILQKTR